MVSPTVGWQSVSNQENALLICPQANLMEEIPRLGFPLSKGVKLATKISHCNPFMCRVQWHYMYSHFGTTLPSIHLQNSFIFLTKLVLFLFPMGDGPACWHPDGGWPNWEEEISDVGGGGIAEMLSFGKRGQTLPPWIMDHSSQLPEGRQSKVWRLPGAWTLWWESGNSLLAVALSQWGRKQVTSGNMEEVLF